MNKYKKLILVFGILLNTVLQANAQEPKELSLKEALNYALKNKAEAKKGLLDITKSE